jgi:DnaD/phage-associated family protein
MNKNKNKRISSPVSSPVARVTRKAPVDPTGPKGDDEDQGKPSKGRKVGLEKTGEYIAVFNAWTEALGRLCTSIDYQRLSEMMATYSPEAVRVAIGVAHEHNARSLAYVQRVLDNGRQDSNDLTKYPNAFRNKFGKVIRDSKGNPMAPRKGMRPKWNEDQTDIVGWLRE